MVAGTFIHYLCENIFAMTTIIINERSSGAKKLIEYLKTQPFVTIVEEKTPSLTLAKSIKEAKSGKTTEYNNTEELFSKLRKKANV
jgi:hypothetical protein